MLVPAMFGYLKNKTNPTKKMILRWIQVLHMPKARFVSVVIMIKKNSFRRSSNALQTVLSSRNVERMASLRDCIVDVWIGATII